MYPQDDQSAGPGEGPAATGVEPGPSTEGEPSEHTGDVQIPLGRPVDEEQWRELKRRADQPDPSAEQYPSSSAD
ncbi:MAG: hypothetical protein ACRDUV_18835 [Pseudonocardiaceae bacterium]